MNPADRTRRPSLRAALAAAALAIAAGACMGGEQLTTIEPFRFAVFGNTNPASPFTGGPERLRYSLKTIEADNPILVVHTGNLVRGGRAVMGITEKDMRRQWRAHLRRVLRFRPFLYTVAGRRDRYERTWDLYRENTKRSLDYSFNYGPFHFVVLHVPGRTYKPGREQLAWLNRDLERHSRSAAIFVFTHHPLVAAPASGLRPAEAGESLHEIFRRYPVRAVIAGASKRFAETERDGIKYYIAGCGGFTKEEQPWLYNQYYLAECNGRDVTLNPKKITFPPPRGGSQQPYIQPSTH